jgi:hypothetical protein
MRMQVAGELTMDALQGPLIYLLIAVVTVILTFVLIAITKKATLAAISSPVIVAIVTALASRFELGHWDPLAPIAFFAVFIFCLVVSLAFVGIARAFRWQMVTKGQPDTDRR